MIHSCVKLLVTCLSLETYIAPSDIVKANQMGRNLISTCPRTHKYVMFYRSRVLLSNAGEQTTVKLFYIARDDFFDSTDNC